MNRRTPKGNHSPPAWNGPGKQHTHPSHKKPPSAFARIAGLGLLLALTAACTLPIMGFARIYASYTGRPLTPLSLFIATFLWFVLLYFLIKGMVLLRHRRRGEMFHYPQVLDSALVALDEISAGNFDVVLKTDEYHHYHKLVEKINGMAQNLSSMEHMRQDFVSNVSHEINSPLTSIQGFARLLKKEDLPPEIRAHYLDVIESECKRLSRMSRNLLQLSMLDKEHGEQVREQYRLDKQLEHSVLLLEPQWLEKELDVQIDLSPVTIRGDQALLEQLWINLIHNAVKFTPAGGGIAVTLAQREGEAVCTVADTGMGIAPDCLPHIFERFYKADKARDRSIGGNGLGLSLAKKIVEVHGGTISVDSVLGAGTTFTVRLPAEN